MNNEDLITLKNNIRPDLPDYIRDEPIPIKLKELIQECWKKKNHMKDPNL